MKKDIFQICVMTLLAASSTAFGRGQASRERVPYRLRPWPWASVERASLWSAALVPQRIARITERISIPSHLRQVSTSWQAALNARKGSRRLEEPYASLPFGASGNAKPPVRFTRHVASMVTSEVTFAMGQGSKLSPRCSIHAYSCALYGAKKSSSMWSSAREERDFLPWFLFIA